MLRTQKTLLLSALALLGAGAILYHIGSRLNLAAGTSDGELWEQAPGDIWLYVGGLLMLIAGSVGLAAFRLWRQSKDS